MEWIEKLLAELDKTSILYFKGEDGKVEIEVVRSQENGLEDEVRVQSMEVEEKVEDHLEWDVLSPGVGYFEKEKDEDGKPLIKLRQWVSSGEHLANIKTMNIQHEVYLEKEGKLVEILVEEGQVVEYGQPLFRFRKVLKDKN